MPTMRRGACTRCCPAGVVKAGEEVEIVGLRDTIKSTVTGVEMFKKSLNQVGRGPRGSGRGLEVVPWSCFAPYLRERLQGSSTPYCAYASSLHSVFLCNSARTHGRRDRHGRTHPWAPHFAPYSPPACALSNLRGACR